ncbi:NB-ARC domain-containing protein [Hydrococcus rivularis]|uniref:NB-ARC domain-containing protein n=1 Tax=Hydrococcus rivularis TaxID=1616834 RepID=UPI001C315CD1|nr:NB-ARC domain-containing protein [Hydrococcus rivularis]
MKAIAPDRGISDSELEALLLAIEGHSTSDIAKQLGIREEAVRKRLGEVYKKFHITGFGPGKLAKLQQLLVSLYQEHQMRSREQREPGEKNARSYQDWEEVPTVSAFYGRTQELAALEQWIVKDRCRLVALLGIGGIGKTTLTAKLVKQIQGEFQFIIWRSLRRTPPINEFLDDLLLCFPHQKTDIPSNTDSKISRAIEQLRSSRCLLILDDVEAILNKGIAGHYREGYESYGELIRRLGEKPHQSCILILSLEKPKEVALLERENLPARSLQLSGLKAPEAREILKSKGLPEDSEWDTLIKLYRGNPLALKIIATTIQEFFAGSVTEFLQYNTLVIGDISDFLEQQFDRLSELEKDIMYCLAIAQEPISLPKLREQFFLPVSPSGLLEALESLRQRSLIEKGQDSATGFTLQPVIMEFVTNRLVEQVCEEIATQKLDKIQLLRNQILFEIPAQNTLKNLETRPIVTRIKNRLFTMFRNEKLIEAKLSEIQSLLQDKSPLEIGYVDNNVRYLLEQFKSKLTSPLKEEQL